MYLRALAIQEKVHGRDHLAVGITLNRLGQLYVQNGESRAEGILTRALATLQGAGGAEHPEVATTLTALGRVAASRGESQIADAYTRRALTDPGKDVRRGPYVRRRFPGATWGAVARERRPRPGDRAVCARR